MMPMSLGLGLGLVHGGGASFSPVRLFTTGLHGAWWDPSDISTLFQDDAGTTPVTASGQTVGRMLDKSGNGNHAIQATASRRPVYTVSGSTAYLAFEGVDDCLDAADNDTLDFGQGEWIAQMIASIGGTSWTVPMGKSSSTLANNIRLFIDGSSDKPRVNWGNDSQFYAIPAAAIAITRSTPQVTEWGVSGSNAYAALNGTENLAAVTLSGTGANAEVWRIGGDLNNVYHKPINFYGAVLRKTPFLTSTERTNLRKWLGAKAGLSL